MFTSNGIEFQTPFTTALDKSGIPVDPAMREICGHTKTTPDTVHMVMDLVAKEDAARSAMIEQYCKDNNVQTSPITAGVRYSFNVNDARAKASKGAWKTADMARNLAENADPCDRAWAELEAVSAEIEAFHTPRGKGSEVIEFGIDAVREEEAA